MKSGSWAIAVVVLGAVHCHSYEINEKLLDSISGLRITNITGGTTDGTSLTYTVSNAVNLSATVKYNGAAGISIDAAALPSYLSAIYEGSGKLTITKLQAAMPTTISGDMLTPVIVFNYSGGSVSIPVNLTLKRAFVSSTVTNETFSAGSFTTGCTSGTSIEKANCGCQKTAAGGGLKNASRYRAWLSYQGTSPYPTVSAKCNITNKTSGVFDGVSHVNVTAPGSGYTTPPSVTYLTGCSGLAPTFSAVISDGGLLAVNVDSPGSGCTGTPTVNITGGGGSGAAINVFVGPCKVSGQDGGPWYTTQTSANLIARNAGVSVAGELFHSTTPLLVAINYNESGNLLTATPYTGTSPDGRALALSCTQWTVGGSSCGRIGDSSTTTIPSWTDSNSNAAGAQHSIFCFEAD